MPIPLNAASAVRSTLTPYHEWSLEEALDEGLTDKEREQGGARKHIKGVPIRLQRALSSIMEHYTDRRSAQLKTVMKFGVEVLRCHPSMSWYHEEYINLIKSEDDDYLDGLIWTKGRYTLRLAQFALRKGELQVPLTAQCDEHVEQMATELGTSVSSIVLMSIIAALGRSNKLVSVTSVKACWMELKLFMDWVQNDLADASDSAGHWRQSDGA
jgi:hypothetical protein